MLKVEFHSHSGDDPADRIPYSTADLIERAAALGYDALAVTLHDRQLDLSPWQSLASDRGVLLIPGIERTIQGKHVLLVNFSSASERVKTFADLAALKRDERGLVIAPHPFFPGSTCLGQRMLEEHANLFDAVEYNAMFTRSVNFNRAAERWARLHGTPVVGNGDVHRLEQLGSTFSLVDALPEATAVCEAVRAGNVHAIARPLTWARTASLAAQLLVIERLRDLRTPRARFANPRESKRRLESWEFEIER